MTPGAGGTHDRVAVFAVFLVAVAVLGAQAAAQYRPEMYFEGDCPYYISTTLSIVHDFDIDLRNQLLGGLPVHGRQIALGRDGQWYPKHSLLMPVLAVPFYALFGMPGFAIFGLLILGMLAMAFFCLARLVAPRLPSAAAALLLIAGTFLRRYDYNITPDLLAALVAALGLFLLLRGRDLGGGCVFGVAVFAKLTNLFLLPFAWIYVFLCRGRRGLGRSIAAAAVPLSFLLLLNQVLFGSPLVTSYDRNVLPRNGELTLVSHRGQFDGELWEGLSGILLNRDHGLIPTSPALWIALPGLALMWRSHRREAALTLVLGEFYLLLFATYRYWATTRYGNRFLILLLVLAAAPMALALEWTVARVKDWMGAARPESRTAAQSGS
jgi:hypothetical protein